MCKHKQRTKSGLGDPPAPHKHLRTGTWTQQPPQAVMTNPHQRAAKGTLILPSLLILKNNHTWCTWSNWWLSPPQGTPLRGGSSQVRHAGAPCHCSHTHQEVTIMFCGLHSPLSFQRLPWIRAAGCDLTDTGPAVRGSTITLRIHVHTQECVFVDLFQPISMCACTQLLLKPRDLGGHLSRCPHVPRPFPERSSWFNWSHVPGCWCHTEFRDTAGEGPHVCSMGWPQQWGACPPSPCHRLIQDLPERKTSVSTVPIKNKLWNRWIPISCSSGTVQPYPSLAVAQGRFHIVGRASQTLHSRTDPCACVERGFVTDLLLARCKLRRAGRGHLFTFHYYHQWRIILESFSWLGARLLSTSFAAAVSPAVLLGCTLIPGPGRTHSCTPNQGEQEGRGIRAMLPHKGRCHPLAVHLASDGSCWPYCGFHLLNWSPVSTQVFPLTELESTAGQNISTPFMATFHWAFPSPRVWIVWVFCRYILKSPICDPIWLQGNKVAC